MGKVREVETMSARETFGWLIGTPLTWFGFRLLQFSMWAERGFTRIPSDPELSRRIHEAMDRTYKAYREMTRTADEVSATISTIQESDRSDD